MNVDFMIEKASLNDLDEVEDLYNDVTDYFAATRNYAGWIKGEYPVRATAEQAITEGSLFVLKIANVIAGSMVLNQRPDPTYQQAKWSIECDDEHIMVIHTLAVHPQFMQRGVARNLMNFAKQYATAHKRRSIRLDTSIDNQPAITLYEKLGYRYTGTVDLGLNLPGFVWFNLYELLLPMEEC